MNELVDLNETKRIWCIYEYYVLICMLIHLFAATFLNQISLTDQVIEAMITC